MRIAGSKIGGHISEEDSGLFSRGPGYHEGMRRELMGEVAIEGVKEAAVAVINDGLDCCRADAPLCGD